MQSNYHDIELQNLGNKANSNGVPKVTFNDNEDGKKILNSASVIKDERKQLKKKSSAATIWEEEEDGRRKSKFYDSKKVHPV